METTQTAEGSKRKSYRFEVIAIEMDFSERNAMNNIVITSKAHNSMKQFKSLNWDT